ncbi:NAD(P)H-dependent oxidoreductase [Chromatiaceae bacterium AAb-1]|nr:NAD(P)H-dependent oxidoreductase [Chromatiaceae bacterium AAb-1]
MNHILVINSSLSGDASVSRLLVADTVQRLLAVDPNAVITYRDVGDAPIPHLTSATVAGIRAVAETEAELALTTAKSRLAQTIVPGFMPVVSS